MIHITYICMHNVYIYTYMYACMHFCVDTYMHTIQNAERVMYGGFYQKASNRDTNTYIHTHIHTYEHAHIHIYIHTYIHTCIQRWTFTALTLARLSNAVRAAADILMDVLSSFSHTDGMTLAMESRHREPQKQLSSRTMARSCRDRRGGFGMKDGCVIPKKDKVDEEGERAEE